MIVSAAFFVEADCGSACSASTATRTCAIPAQPFTLLHGCSPHSHTLPSHRWSSALPRQYNFIRLHRSSGWRFQHYRVPTGLNGGRLTSCPCSIGSGCGSVDSAAAAASRCFSSSASNFFCRSMIGFTPTLSGGTGDPTTPHPTNSPVITPIRTDVTLCMGTFTRASARVP
jgi:hypothetical protein